MAVGTPGERRASPKAQSGTTGQRWLGKHRRRAALSGPTLCPGNHLDRTYQQASRQPTSRPFWYQKNMQTCCTEILLANAPP